MLLSLVKILRSKTFGVHCKSTASTCLIDLKSLYSHVTVAAAVLA